MITKLTFDQLTPDLAEKLNRTFKKYIGVSYWSEPILKRVFSSWVKKHEEPVSYLVSDGIDYVLLYVFEETFFNVDGNIKFGIEYAERFIFPHINLWFIVPVLKRIGAYLEWSRSVNSYYLEYQVPVPLEDFIKGFKNNFKPHFFGEKSKKYSITTIDAYSPDNKLTCLNVMINTLKMYGWERYKYLKDKGETYIEPEMYDFVFDFHNLCYIEDLMCGISQVKTDKGDLLGFLSWYMYEDPKGNKIGCLGEIVISKDPSLKNLSLYLVTTIKTMHYLFTHLGCNQVYTGFNLNTLGDYKEVLRPKVSTIRFSMPWAVSAKAVGDLLMQIFGTAECNDKV